MHAASEQFAFERLRDCRFSRARQSSEPNHRAPVSQSRRASSRCNLLFDPEDVFALRCRVPVGVNAAEDRAATANLAAVRDDESTQLRIAIVIVDHERAARLNREASDFVALELFAFLFRCFECRGIHHLIDRNDLAFHVLRREAKIVNLSELHRLAHDPKHVRVNPVRLDRRFGLMRANVTALDEDLFGQSNSDRIARDRFLVGILRPTFDRVNFRCLVRRRKY